MGRVDHSSALSGANLDSRLRDMAVFQVMCLFYYWYCSSYLVLSLKPEVPRYDATGVFGSLLVAVAAMG